MAHPLDVEMKNIDVFVLCQKLFLNLKIVRHMEHSENPLMPRMTPRTWNEADFIRFNLRQNVRFKHGLVWHLRTKLVTGLAVCAIAIPPARSRRVLTLTRALPMMNDRPKLLRCPKKETTRHVQTEL